MDHIRKKRWVRYSHIKCKMYLRNDFRFECAYCRMRERDAGSLLEDYFEKDHFIARTSRTDIDIDAYDNMIYACAKCNGTKSNKSIEVLLDPCKDNIYSGSNPHVVSLGKEGEYQLRGNTPEGWQYIDSLKLNSKFYRELRRKQEQADSGNRELRNLLQEITDLVDIPDVLLQRLEELLRRNYLISMDQEQTVSYKCGRSRAGEAFQEVIRILNSLSVTNELLFAANDLDIKIQYRGCKYLCEIRLNCDAEKPVKEVRMEGEQLASWRAAEGHYGVLYYYMKTGRLEFHVLSGEAGECICLKEG